MIIDNIIVIIVAIILITYLSINYVKKNAPVNLLLIAICSFSLGVYLPVVFYSVQLRLRFQIPLRIGIFVLPCIVAILQYNNISFGKNLLYKRAEKYYNNKKFTKCISTLQKLINKDGRKSENLYLLSKCFYEIKEYTQAKEMLYEVIQKDENNADAYFTLGSILEKEDDIESAIDMYRKCIELDPLFYDAYEVLGILIAGQGDYESAEELYKKAMDYHAESYELLYNLAMIQLELGKTDEAEKNLELALVINPNINEAIYSLGNIKLLKGDYKEALKLYNEITKSESYGLKAYYKIAIIYVTKNEFDKAMGIIEYLINQDKSYIDIIENEFIFNAMRSRIDSFLKNRKEIENLEIQSEQAEIEYRKKTRKNWFGRDKENKEEENSILYDDIDITRTGFRAEENENNN